MATITLDTQEIARLSKEGGKFAMNAESEVALARLLFIREKIDEFITEAKAEIEKSALDLDKDFTGLKGDKIKHSSKSQNMLTTIIVIVAGLLGAVVGRVLIPFLDWLFMVEIWGWVVVLWIWGWGLLGGSITLRIRNN
jgi:hypothetical protein